MSNTYIIENYLGGGKLYCREERQYALFLYNALLNMKNGMSNGYEKIKKLFDCEDENKEVKIKEVFYEATLLRDYHYPKSNSENFNKRLIRFCMPDMKDEDIEKIIGLISKTSKEPGFPNVGNKNVTSWIKGDCSELDIYGNDKKEEIRRRLLFAKCMMQAKPDIMVIYEQGGKKRALSIECKHESGNGKYEDLDGRKTIHQELIQEFIMAFLFGKRFEEIADEKMEKFVPYIGTNKDEDKKVKWKTEYDLTSREDIKPGI